jgi:hypothetical protein
MAYDFDTSVGGANSTSYPTLEDATNYLTARGGASAFFALDGSDQEQRLIYGTSQLDLLSIYDGTMADMETPQALAWPRVEATDCNGVTQDSTSIPAGIKNAAIELAWYQTEADRLSTPALLGQGMKRAKAGPLEVEVDVNVRYDVASRNVEIQLGCLGSLKGIASFNSVTQGLASRA